MKTLIFFTIYAFMYFHSPFRIDKNYKLKSVIERWIVYSVNNSRMELASISQTPDKMLCDIAHITNHYVGEITRTRVNAPLTVPVPHSHGNKIGRCGESLQQIKMLQTRSLN